MKNWKQTWRSKFAGDLAGFASGSLDWKCALVLEAQACLTVENGGVVPINPVLKVPVENLSLHLAAHLLTFHRELIMAIKGRFGRRQQLLRLATQHGFLSDSAGLVHNGLLPVRPYAIELLLPRLPGLLNSSNDLVGLG
jgi:hypothetical protein